MQTTTTTRSTSTAPWVRTPDGAIQLAPTVGRPDLSYLPPLRRRITAALFTVCLLMLVTAHSRHLLLPGGFDGIRAEAGRMHRPGALRRI